MMATSAVTLVKKRSGSRSQRCMNVNANRDLTADAMLRKSRRACAVAIHLTARKVPPHWLTHAAPEQTLRLQKKKPTSSFDIHRTSNRFTTKDSPAALNL